MAAEVTEVDTSKWICALDMSELLLSSFTLSVVFLTTPAPLQTTGSHVIILWYSLRHVDLDGWCRHMLVWETVASWEGMSGGEPESYMTSGGTWLFELPHYHAHQMCQVSELIIQWLTWFGDFFRWLFWYKLGSEEGKLFWELWWTTIIDERKRS